jgi:hypothetical protein
MAKVLARNAVVLITGKNLSGNSNNVTLTRSAEAPEVTCFGDSTKQRLSDGVKDVEFRLDGFYNTTASTTDATFSEGLAGASSLSFIPQGLATSNVVHNIGGGIESNYEIKSALAEACTVSMTVMAGSHSRGKLIYAACSAGSTSTSSVDFAAIDSVSQYVLHILSACTSISASIQDSADDSSWTTQVVHDGLTASGMTYTGSWANAARYRMARYANVGGSGALALSLSGSSI